EMDAVKSQGGFLMTESDGTQHLPTTTDGKIDHRLMGAAWAALHGGYRGNKYQGPGKEEALSKLKKLYERENMDLPGEAGKAAPFYGNQHAGSGSGDLSHRAHTESTEAEVANTPEAHRKAAKMHKDAQ